MLIFQRRLTLLIHHCRYATSAAPIWNLVTKRLPFFTNPRWGGRDGNGLVKDWTNGVSLNLLSKTVAFAVV